MVQLTECTLRIIDAMIVKPLLLNLRRLTGKRYSSPKIIVLYRCYIEKKV